MRRPPRAVRSWSAVTVLSLVMFLLILLWLGRRKGSENIAQTKRIKSMQTELKIVVRDCDGWRDQILQVTTVATELILLNACVPRAQLSLGQVLNLCGATFQVSRMAELLLAHPVYRSRKEAASIAHIIANVLPTRTVAANRRSRSQTRFTAW